MKTQYLAATAFGALTLGLAMPAAAQDTAPPAPAATATETTAAPADAASGEVVITAQGRAQVLADVPLAVSAVTAESMQNSGATDIRALTQLTPSLIVSSTGTEANGSARIRGIGTVGDNPGLESSVAVFVDGVYRSRSGSGLNELGEIDRVEVLRGPQGTLFGRNASAGIISITSKRPSFTFGGGAEASYGNYDYWRIAGGVTGPISETVAARVDGVYVKRDGFLNDITQNRKINDRDRYFVKGQLLFQPSSDLSIRVIGDFSKKSEACCAAAYKDTRGYSDPTPGAPGDSTPLPLGANPIVQLIGALGGQFPDAGQPYSRRISNTPGRFFSGTTTDGGVSGQIDYDFGGAKLTSITAYREYKSGGGGDIDYSTLDILYRADNGGAFRQFKTFSQELRLQGSAWDDKFDWLVGGYYANEKLLVKDNLQFGADYGRYNSCVLVTALVPTLGAGIRQLGAPGCLSAVGRGTLVSPLVFGPTQGGALVTVLDRLSAIANVGTTNARYDQKSENYAIFTHNIISFTDRLKLTLGARYTHETKDFRSVGSNNNVGCTNVRAAALPLLADPTTNATIRSLLGNGVVLGCLFNFNPALDALDLRDKNSDGEFTGTAVASYKPNDDLMLYASYSRGYKAGGYNLDRSALGSPTGTFTNASVSGLRFDAEKVNAYEAGFKLDLRRFDLNVAAFRQEFKNFQLNTFNGLFFVVQTTNGCSALAGGDAADEDLSDTTGACTGKIKPGVISQGVEVEASIQPHRDLSINLGYTYTSAKFAKNLVGNAGGAPLTSALFAIPGQQVSNAPENVVTMSVAWTPQLSDSGWSGLAYVDGRLSSDYNTGSDLFKEKRQDGFATFNARVGLRAPEQRWGIELWAQNVFNKGYDQVAFSSPLQGSASQVQTERFGGTSTRMYSAFLAEPRTYGVTLRGKF